MELHGHNIVQMDLTPENIVHFPDGRWRVANFENWARSGGQADIHYSLRYSAPEVRSVCCVHCVLCAVCVGGRWCWRVYPCAAWSPEFGCDTIPGAVWASFSQPLDLPPSPSQPAQPPSL